MAVLTATGLLTIVFWGLLILGFLILMCKIDNAAQEERWKVEDRERRVEQKLAKAQARLDRILEIHSRH